jgi:SNF2 family DNA or RNA helicase
MGLGKTIQAIAAAELLVRHCGAERVLIVCPTSLTHQWQREIARFTSHEAQVIHGLRPLRQRQYADVSESGGWAKITNYETISRDLDLINAWAPDIVIIDEAQRIKNWNTIAARALKRVNSPYAIVLTGTPLENRLEELISIVQFVDRYRLGPSWRLLHEHQTRDNTGRVVGYRDLGRIGATLAPVMLRRRKAEVLSQLPERIDNTLFVSMTAQQLVHHAENGDVVGRIVKRWRRTGFLSDVDQRRLTCALQNMRVSCNSTYLLGHETDHGHKADELMTLLGELPVQPDAKVVIFSQWVRTHELIIRRLQPRDWGHVLFHGGVAADKRPALVDRFHDDPECRVFLSTDAGGVGLNLQHAAAAIVNMAMPWNPAVLEQRIGRVHRLGQRKSVQVVNFVAQGSIEEGMLSVLAFKKSHFAGVLDGGESEVFLQGTRLSKFMESVDKVTGAMGDVDVAGEPLIDDPASQPELVASAPDAMSSSCRCQRRRPCSAWSTRWSACSRGCGAADARATASPTPRFASNRGGSVMAMERRAVGAPYRQDFLSLSGAAILRGSSWRGGRVVNGSRL